MANDKKAAHNMDSQAWYQKLMEQRLSSIEDVVKRLGDSISEISKTVHQQAENQREMIRIQEKAVNLEKIQLTASQDRQNLWKAHNKFKEDTAKNLSDQRAATTRNTVIVTLVSTVATSVIASLIVLFVSRTA